MAYCNWIREMRPADKIPLWVWSPQYNVHALSSEQNREPMCIVGKHKQIGFL